jgi:hypothetical protein
MAYIRESKACRGFERGRMLLRRTGFPLLAAGSKGVQPSGVTNALMKGLVIHRKMPPRRCGGVFFDLPEPTLHAVVLRMAGVSHRSCCNGVAGAYFASISFEFLPFAGLRGRRS